MARIILAVALLAGALVPGGQASSLRARKMHARNVVPADSFRKNFGWPGHQFPHDRWGAVMDSEAAEEAAAEAATATITRPNLGTAPVNIEPSPVISNPAPLISGFSVISTVSQTIPTSSVALGDISVSNATASSPSSSPASKTTSQLLSPLVSTHKPSPSVSPISSSSVETPSISPSSIHKQQPSSIPPSFTPSPSPPPSSQAPPPSSSPASKPSSSSPPAPPPPAPSSAPVNVGSGGGNSNQGNQGQGSGNSGSSSSTGGTSPSDIQAYLTGHNTARAQHGAAPLSYSQSLAAKAQQWANGCVFQHSEGTLGPFGENLAAGTGNFGIAQGIGDWVAEVSQYNPNNPVASHFTQVVWKSTTEVGCAVQSCSNIFPGDGVAQYYVCEYSPAGNVIGEFAARGFD